MRVRMEGLIDPQEGGEVLMMEIPVAMGVLMEMGMAMGDPIEMVIQMAMVIQIEMGNHPGEGKNLLEEMENQVKVVGDQTPVMMMGGGDGSSSPSLNATPPPRRRHRRPRFVYVVQGPPGPPGQVGQPGQVGKDIRDGQAHS